MSADNIVWINKKTFEVKEGMSEMTPDRMRSIGKGKSLAEAVDIAENYCREELVEYGIRFYE
jgi:hypothetical protein